MKRLSQLTATNATYISELCNANFSQLGDGLISRLGLDEELAKRHFFTSEHRPHLEDCRLSLLSRHKLNEIFSCKEEIIAMGLIRMEHPMSHPNLFFYESFFTSRPFHAQQLTEQLNSL